MRITFFSCLGLIVLLSLPACQTTSQSAAQGNDAEGPSQRLSVGTVQRKITVGMTGAEVATVLGSPNIVTTDEKRREVWVYDKISTDRVSRSSWGGVNALLFGGAGGALFGGGANSASGSTSQKTLTVVIKFDEAMKVRDFAYHTSRF